MASKNTGFKREDSVTMLSTSMAAISFGVNRSEEELVGYMCGSS